MPAATFRTTMLALVCLATGASVACGRRDRESEAPEGPVSDMEAQRRVREAIRRSSEGVILMPSRKADRVFELPRLNEIAQDLRQPFAACFVRRAIVTMKPRDSDSGYDDVPEGQAKIRTRIAPSGEVVRAEVLQTGFADAEVEACLTAAIERQRWPQNETGNVHFIDIVYWVSLGAQRDRETPAFARRLRRETLAAGVRAKPCLQGRVDAGRYDVEGLNLVDREGGTLANRIDQKVLPDPIRACIAQAFKEIRLDRDPDAFVRPISPRVQFDVTRDGTISVIGEDWLRLVEMEEAARNAQQRAAMTGELEGDVVRPPPDTAEPEPAVDPLVDEGEPEPEPEVEPQPKVDPGQGGLKLPLGGQRRQ